MQPSWLHKHRPRISGCPAIAPSLAIVVLRYSRSETSWKSRKKKEFDHDLLIFEFRYLNEGVRRRVLNTRNGVYWMFIICKVIRRGIESRNKIFIDFQSNRIIGRNSAKLLQGGILVKSNTIFRSIFFRHSPFPREC